MDVTQWALALDNTNSGNVSCWQMGSSNCQLSRGTNPCNCFKSLHSKTIPAAPNITPFWYIKWKLHWKCKNYFPQIMQGFSGWLEPVCCHSPLDLLQLLQGLLPLNCYYLPGWSWIILRGITSYRLVKVTNQIWICHSVRPWAGGRQSPSQPVHSCTCRWSPQIPDNWFP